MNLLNPTVISKILNRLDEEKANTVIMNSMDFDFAEVEDNFEGFKNDLSQFIQNQKKKPFNHKIMQMVSDFNPLKEGLLYTYLAKSGMFEEMAGLAKQHIPFECIRLIPKESLKDIMQSYPMNKKVQVLNVCGDEMKDTLLNSFAETGSSARQMIDLEFDSFNSDKLALARLQIQKDTILKEFVTYVRDYVNTNKQLQSDLVPVISEWIDTNYQQKAELKLVS